MKQIVGQFALASIFLQAFIRCFLSQLCGDVPLPCCPKRELSLLNKRLIRQWEFELLPLNVRTASGEGVEWLRQIRVFKSIA